MSEDYTSTEDEEPDAIEARIERVETIIERLETEEPLVVTVFWDSGERYMSTGLFDEG